MTTEELLKLKTDYAAWFVPGDEMDLSEVADDVTKLVDELLVTRGNLAAVTAQLAERSLVAEQLSMALNVRDTQLATITAERDAAVSALRLTRAAQGQHTGVFMRLDAYQDLLSQIATLEEQVKALRVDTCTRAETAEARLLALQVDRSRAVKLRDDTDNVIWALKPADVPGAINWGDLGVREVQEVIDDERRWYRVIIEEADPSNPALHAAVTAGLVALGWPADDIEIETAW